MLNEVCDVAGRLNLKVNNQLESQMNHVFTISINFSALKNELSDRSNGAVIHLNNIAINRKLPRSYNFTMYFFYKGVRSSGAIYISQKKMNRSSSFIIILKLIQLRSQMFPFLQSKV